MNGRFPVREVITGRWRNQEDKYDLRGSDGRQKIPRKTVNGMYICYKDSRSRLVTTPSYKWSGSPGSSVLAGASCLNINMRRSNMVTESLVVHFLWILEANDDGKLLASEKYIYFLQ